MPPLLARVSRSFYLSMRLLPGGMREPVALGYLLARTSDTIADAPGQNAARRLRLLDEFADVVSGRRGAQPLRSASGASEAERELLAAFPEAIAQLNALPCADRDDVLAVLARITRGQRLDIERSTLSTAEELDEYTYLVAGCVGEFWTRLAFRHIPRFAQFPETEMLDLGRRYGMGLQLVNVLRDVDTDRALGRSYLPEPRDAAAWRSRAEQGLEAGMRYAMAVRSRRVRVASALPALVGIRTLDRLRAAEAQAPVKVPRAEVRALLTRIAFSFGSRGQLQREWDNRAR